MFAVILVRACVCGFDDIRHNPGNRNTTHKYTQTHSVRDQWTLCTYILWLHCQSVILHNIYYVFLGYLEKKT